MAATITNSSSWTANKRHYTRGTANLGTYADGGVSITANDVKLGLLEGLQIENTSGYKFEYDYTNEKLKAYWVGEDPLPLLIVEEVITIASHTATLANLPLYIVAVETTAGDTTGACNVIPTGESPASLHTAVTFTTGAMTFNATDNVTAARVTYMPQQPSGPFSAANLVVDESVTAAAAKANFANRACLIQYVWNDTNSVLPALEPPGQAPSATNTAVLDINDSSNTSVDTHADDDGDTLKVTYIKYAALSSDDQFIDDTDITLSSEAYDFTAVAGYDGIVLPGVGTHFVGESAAADEVATWTGPSGTAADTVAVWTPSQNHILTNNTAAILTSAISWVVLSPVLAPAAMGEAAAGLDLSGVTFRFIAEGPY